jgi:hypothetical protein
MKVQITFNKLQLTFISLSVLFVLCFTYTGVSKTFLRNNGVNKEQFEAFLIDDFSRENGISAMGTKWRMFTDRVMGGVSIATSGYQTVEGRHCLRLEGTVSLENNGGFIQVALPLDIKGDFFNASQFSGVRLSVRGNGKKYHVHLRTDQTPRPWQYFSAPFLTKGKWEEVEIPFQHFQPENLSGQLNVEKLRRIAVVAIKEEFQADIAISRLEFYR